MTCMLCGEDLESAITVSERARGVPSHRVMCSSCGLVQVSPRPESIEAPSPEPIRLRGRDVPPGTVEHAELMELLAANRRALTERAFGCVAEPSSIDPAALDPLPHEPLSMPEIAAVYDAMRWPDPLRTLLRLRELGVERVLLEVPDIDAYVGDRDGHHFKPHQFYDFSAATLISLLLRAGYGDVHVVAHDGLLTAWGTAGAAPILCDDADARLASLRSTPLECVPDDAATLLEKWLAGASLADLGADEAALRADFAVLQTTYAAMLRAWEDAHRSLSTTQDAWSRASRSQLEHMETDAWLMGAEFGKGVAYDQAAKAVSHIVHRMGRLSGAYR